MTFVIMEEEEMDTGSQVPGTYYNIQSRDKYHCLFPGLNEPFHLTVTTLDANFNIFCRIMKEYI